MTYRPTFHLDGDWVREIMRTDRIDTLAVAEFCNRYIAQQNLKARPVTEGDVWNALARSEQRSSEAA